MSFPPYRPQARPDGSLSSSSPLTSLQSEGQTHQRDDAADSLVDGARVGGSVARLARAGGAAAGAAAARGRRVGPGRRGTVAASGAGAGAGAGGEGRGEAGGDGAAGAVGRGGDDE